MRRTVDDWLKHAGAASDPAEVARCLDEAAAEATACHHWRTLLRGLPDLRHVSRERVIDVADRTLQLARAEREVWGFRDVATVRAACLDDRAAARAALEAGETTFRKPRTDAIGRAFARGYEWVLLGRGYMETLDDGAGMRRCLETGRDMARARASADDLCSIASEWATRVDRTEGIVMLREAEGMMKKGSAEAWTFANAWHALDDATAVRRVLDGALKAATTTQAALLVAKAWASHDERGEVSRALSSAEALATTASEWLEIGELAFDARLEESRLRHAVERAEALCGDDDLRGRVSSAYAHWLHDEAAAVRVGPRGVRPEALRVRVRELGGWETCAASLFDWLRARATPQALAHIASADWGANTEKHLAVLQDICETGLVPRTLAWEPHEVLALTRWSSGEGVRHLDRALCCVLLCMAPGDFDEIVTDGIILLESCWALGVEAGHLAELFFAWLCETEPSTNEASDASSDEAIALLLLFVMRAAAAPEDPRLPSLASRIAEHPRCSPSDVAQRIGGSMGAALWRDLFDRILAPLRASHSHVARLLDSLGRA
jgi:hypothetical protein